MMAFVSGATEATGKSDVDEAENICGSASVLFVRGTGDWACFRGITRGRGFFVVREGVLMVVQILRWGGAFSTICSASWSSDCGILAPTCISASSY